MSPGYPGLHLPTLFLTTALSIALCGVLLAVVRRRGQTMDVLAWWGLTMALAAAGLLLMEAGAVVPRFLAVDVARGLLLLAAASCWTAARVFVGRPPHYALGLAGTAVWLLACRIPAFNASDAAQMTLSCAIGSLYNLVGAVTLLSARREKLRSLPAAVVLLSLHAAVYGVRAILAVTGTDRGFEDLLATVLLIEGQLRTIGTTFVFLDMTRERAEQQTLRSMEAARQAGAARERFLAHMSHEIRTPLHAVFGLAQVLALDDRLLPDQREHVTTIETAGRHLLAIVNDALDLAKIDAGRLDLAMQPFPLHDTVQNCIALVRATASEKRITLTTALAPSLPILVRGDRIRLQQILLNLLWNAIRFTPTDGRVTLRAAMPFDSRLAVDVLDSGPGIPLAKQGRLFTDFTQLDPGAAQSTGGSGLGLAICARLVETMSGRIGYEASPGGGSRFWLELPWAAVPEAENGADRMAPA